MLLYNINYVKRFIAKYAKTQTDKIRVDYTKYVTVRCTDYECKIRHTKCTYSDVELTISTKNAVNNMKFTEDNVRDTILSCIMNKITNCIKSSNTPLTMIKISGYLCRYIKQMIATETLISLCDIFGYEIKHNMLNISDISIMNVIETLCIHMLVNNKITSNEHEIDHKYAYVSVNLTRYPTPAPDTSLDTDIYVNISHTEIGIMITSVMLYSAMVCCAIEIKKLRNKVMVLLSLIESVKLTYTD